METHLLNFGRHPVLKRGGATFNSSAPDKELKGCTAATGRAGISSFDDLGGPRYKVFKDSWVFVDSIGEFFQGGIGECEFREGLRFFMNLLFQHLDL